MSSLADGSANSLNGQQLVGANDTTARAHRGFEINPDEAIYSGILIKSVPKVLIAEKGMNIFGTNALALSPTGISLDRSAHDESLQGRLFVNGRRMSYYEIDEKIDLPVVIDLHIPEKPINSLCLFSLGEDIVLIDPTQITNLVTRIFRVSLQGDKRYLPLIMQLLDCQKLIVKALHFAEDPAGTMEKINSDTQRPLTEVAERQLEHILKGMPINLTIQGHRTQIGLFAGEPFKMANTQAEILLKMAVLPGDFPHPIHLDFGMDGTVTPLSKISGDALVTVGSEYNRTKVIGLEETVPVTVQFTATEAVNPDLTKFEFSLSFKGEGKYTLTLIKVPEKKEKVVES